jgi:hypothetical protein
MEVKWRRLFSVATSRAPACRPIFAICRKKAPDSPATGPLLFNQPSYVDLDALPLRGAGADD